MSTGTIHKKDKFLNNIANQLGRKRLTEKVELPQWSKLPQYDVFKDLSQDDLLAQFVLQCEKIHTNVVITTMEDLQEKFHVVLKDMGGNRLYIGKTHVSKNTV